MNDKRGTVTPERVALNAACVAWLLFVLGCGGVLCGLSCSVRSVRSGRTAPAGDVAPDIWATDGEAPDAGHLIARPMPAAPFKGQKRPSPQTGKCDTDEATIIGACWVEVVRKVGGDDCGPKFFQHEGRCYLPVQEAKRLPTSVMP